MVSPAACWASAVAARRPPLASSAGHCNGGIGFVRSRGRPSPGPWGRCAGSRNPFPNRSWRRRSPARSPSHRRARARKDRRAPHIDAGKLRMALRKRRLAQKVGHDREPLPLGQANDLLGQTMPAHTGTDIEDRSPGVASITPISAAASSSAPINDGESSDVGSSSRRPTGGDRRTDAVARNLQVTGPLPLHDGE